MTEQEWLECTDPRSMLSFLESKPSIRKLRLFGCACCRRGWELLANFRSRKAVEVAEAFADGLADKNSLAAAREQAIIAKGYFPVPTMSAAWHAANAAHAATDESWFSASSSPKTYMAWAIDRWKEAVGPDESRGQTLLLRDIFGNPFRPVVFDPLWRTSNVVAIAQTIYEERRFEDMPILADALEEAGCTSADLLDHCRQSAEHVLGCWALDLILAKQ